MKKRKIALILSILLPFILTAQPDMKDMIDLLITNWHNAAANGDEVAYFNFMDENAIYIGTDSTEIWTKQAFQEWSKPYFSKGKTWRFKATKRNIYLSEHNEIAWFDELLRFPDGTLRGSGVLVYKNGEWKLEHYVLSMPVPNEKFKAINELIKNLDPTEAPKEE
ncbi:MAG: nuclear transport factor 2 family protein [Bacteroidales bacterium]|nr:nuclear transport factor 2 family protein [Bacteroidales bacterium]